MPYRCNNCNKLTNNEGDTQCKKEGAVCDLVKVGVVHFLHQDGPGPIMANARREVVKSEDEQGKREEVKFETVDMHLCCHSRADRPQMTDVRFAVTCLTCLANVPEPEKDKNDEDLDTPAPVETNPPGAPGIQGTATEPPKSSEGMYNPVTQETSSSYNDDESATPLQGAAPDAFRPFPDPQNDPENAKIKNDPNRPQAKKRP